MSIKKFVTKWINPFLEVVNTWHPPMEATVNPLPTYKPFSLADVAIANQYEHNDSYVSIEIIGGTHVSY